MKRALTPIFAAFLLLAPVSALADCKTIVDQTLAELRVAYPEWTDAMETLARTAAASACVKASSVAGGPAMTSTAVVAANTSTTSASEEEEETSESEDDDEGWSPFKDIKFNKVSGRPNKKPYERKRDVTNTDD